MGAVAAAAAAATDTQVAQWKPGGTQRRRREGGTHTNTQTNAALWPPMGPPQRALTEPRTGRPIEAAALGCARVAAAGTRKKDGKKKEVHPAGTRAD